MPRTVTEAAAALAAGHTTAAALTEAALARIADPQGEGARAFITVHAGTACAAAAAMDALRAAGRAPSAYAGIPISIKDLYDEAGVTTRSGSVALKGAPAAKANAPTVQRLIRAGFVILGRTNQVEFAFSGLGVNPHYGTPLSPWDRAGARLPGGSSSGAGVAVADGMGFAALGTDTGGSCRIPAALCGVVGWKPTARRVSIEGILPLAPSLDSAGPLARSVADCAILDGFMAGEENPSVPKPRPLKGLRLGLPRGTFLTDGMDGTVAAVFGRTLTRLSAAGAHVIEFDLPELAEIPAVNAAGGFAASEAWAWHHRLIAEKADAYDPRILKRIRRGERMSAADYVELVNARARIIAAVAPRTAPFDAVICPTCPLVPPRLAEVEDETEYNRINMLLLRNTSIGNFLDRCSISIPCHAEGEAPVGLMLTGEHMGDAALFQVAASVEAALAA
ncbi:amidase [Roseomonas alkaliterrae]|uniref:Aspartyl-tRNA(Asn)/glutamyl-tRNA(Gln) amidotransferase subunit A n=1 Tax=Neoroseomonas alkaliterrae TaxID=1452450 RepID=A0A840Y2C4_9PROT|nr:amidase [Neoroseomonas alkaliterrae]MBB5688383.1 aspartyl-tRNA(Asn)/glutamyl-tRNA(Gln) amidotransferase subunit A [Neoroseomonas alkaliterrae]MBR0677010.1 amidase [Neoroseomonas alkaliterrae]